MWALKMMPLTRGRLVEGGVATIIFGAIVFIHLKKSKQRSFAFPNMDLDPSPILGYTLPPGSLTDPIVYSLDFTEKKEKG